MSRILRNISNSKANKRVLTSNIPARKEGLDGEERVAKITNKGVRLYRKELGQWWYTQFQQSEEADKITIGVATALTLGTVKIGNGLSITSSGTLSTDGSSANYYLDGITKNSNTLTFSVNGATNKSYTFGANAFNSTSIPTNNNQLTNGAGFLTAVATSNIADEAVTLAKIQHVATDIFLGRTSNGTGDVESMSVSDVNVLLSLDNYLTSISTINADKITAGTLPDARIQASGVTQHVGSIVHDSLSGFVANEHLDWTTDRGNTNIHSGNYTDTNTNQLTKFYFVDDDGDAIHPSHDNYIKFMNGNGITTNWNSVESGGGINDPYILTITSTTVGTVTTVGVSAPITGGISQNGATGTIGHSNDAGNTHVPTTASKDGKFLKATSNNGKSEAWTDITENDITDLGTYLTTSQASSAYLTKSSPQLATDTTLSMNNAKISARTSAGGGSDGLGTAGQVLHSHANGGGVYWATVADDMQWILEDHSGDQVTVADGKYVKFVAGTGLNINWNGGAGAVDNEYDLDFTISGYNNSNWDTAYGWGNHASGGYLTGITGQAIGSLSNVSSSSPSNGQILKWSTDTWVVSDNTVTIGSINDITDVSISGTTDNYILMYENATGRWKNEPTTDITSVGTIGTGVWQGTPITSAYLNATQTAITSVGTLTGLSVDGGTSSLNRGNSSGDILDVRGQNTSQMKVTTTAFTVTPDATFGGQVQLDADNADLKLKSGGSGDAQIGFWDGSTNKAYLVWDRSDNRIELNTALDFEVQTNLIVAGISTNYDQLKIKGGGSESGIKFIDSANNTDGFIYATGGKIGFLNSSGAWRIQTLSTGSIISGNISMDGWSTKSISAGSVNSSFSATNTGARIEILAHATNGAAHGSFNFFTNSGDSLHTALNLSESGNATFTGQILRSGSGDTTITNHSTGSGDPSFILNSAVANRSGFLHFKDQDSQAGYIKYVHNGDSMNFHTGNSGTADLTLSGNATFSGNIDLANGGAISSQDSGSGSIKLFGGGTNKGGYINLTGGGNGGDIKMYTGTSGDGALRLTINSSGFTTLAGDLKISDDLYFNSTSAWLIASGSGGTLRIQTFSYFRVDGVIRGYNDVIAYYSSDPTLKDNAKLIENPLDKLSKINGYTFDWNEKAQKIGKHLTGHDYGVMANEIQDVMPELVETRENGIRAVKYEKIIPLLIECIKEQQIQINELKGIA